MILTFYLPRATRMLKYQRILGNRPSMPQPMVHPPPSKTPPSPIRSHPDGVYFVNCQRGNEISSGLAYYRNLNPGANDGQQPDAYVDVSHGSFITWEDAGKGKSLNPSSAILA